MHFKIEKYIMERYFQWIPERVLKCYMGPVLLHISDSWNVKEQIKNLEEMGDVFPEMNVVKTPDRLSH